MKAEKRRTQLLSAAMGFLAAFGGMGALASGMQLEDIRLFTVALVCAAAAVLFSYGAQFRIFPVVPGALAVWGLWLWHSGRLEHAAESLLYQLSVLYDKGYGWGLIRWSEEPIVPADATLALCALGVVVALIVTWSVVRGRSIWLAVAACIVPLVPCMILTDTVPDAGYVFMQILSVLLLLLPWMIRKRDKRQGNALTVLMILPVALALGILFWCMPKDSYSGLTVLDHAFVKVEQLFAGEKLPQRPALPQREGGWVNLTIVGPKELRRTPVMDILAQENGMLYLRGAAYDVYKGTWWDVAAPEVPQMPEIQADKSVMITTKALHDTLFVPYGAVHIAHALTPVHEEDGKVENLGQWRRYSITYGSLPEYSQSWELPAENIPGQYLKLDQSTLERAQALLLRELPELETVSGVWEKARIIVDYVKNSAAYSLYTPRMPAEAVDFALWFLEESDTGYCIHFASAATVLLRAAGIPSRYMTGYLVSASELETVTVQQKNAHAWTEVYVNGVGWMPMEPTPASGVRETAAGEAEGTQPTEETTLPPETTTLTQPTEDTAATESQEATTQPVQSTATEPEQEQPTQQTDISNIGGADGPDIGGADTPKQPWQIPSWLKWMIGVVMLIGAVIGQWRLRVLLRRNKRFKGGYNAQALARWQEVVLHAKVRRIAPDEQLSLLAQKAKFSQHTLTREELKLFDNWLNGSEGTIRHMNLRTLLLATLVYALF